MGSTLNLTDEEREQAARDIENFLEFTRDVLDDPSLLKHIPDGSNVEAIPIAERDPNVHYDVETPRYLAIVTPPDSAPAEPTSRSNGRTRHIERGEAARLKRIRAAHR